MPTKARFKQFPRLGQQLVKDPLKTRKITHYHYCPRCNNGFQCNTIDCKANQWKPCENCK